MYMTVCYKIQQHSPSTIQLPICMESTPWYKERKHTQWHSQQAEYTMSGG